MNTVKVMIRAKVGYTKRCSCHAFGDPVEVKKFYDDLVATGHDLGVSMPVMESYAEAIRRFAI